MAELVADFAAPEVEWLPLGIEFVLVLLPLAIRFEEQTLAPVAELSFQS